MVLASARRRWLAAAAGLGLVALVAAGCGSPQEAADGGSASDKPIKVGLVYSQSGALAAYGKQYSEGFKAGLAFATGGSNKVGKRPVEITEVDDAGDPAKGVNAAKDLIGKGFKIIAGSTSSGVATQVAPLASQNKVLFISGPAATDAITGANKYTFRSGRQTLQDILAAREILGKSTGRRIVVFAQDSAFGQGNVAAVRAIMGGRGHTVSSILVPLSANDFTPFAQQAKNARPDLLFVAWAGTTAPAMWRAMEQQNVMNDVTVATGLAERATWGVYPTGVNFLSHYTYVSPKNKVNDWLKARMRRLNQVPDIFHPDGFNAALMIARAVTRGGGTNVDRMISSLEGFQFVGPKGTNRVRQQDHALLQPMFQVRVRAQGGRPQPVHVKTFSPGNLQPPVTPFK